MSLIRILRKQAPGRTGVNPAVHHRANGRRVQRLLDSAAHMLGRSGPWDEDYRDTCFGIQLREEVVIEP